LIFRERNVFEQAHSRGKVGNKSIRCPIQFHQHQALQEDRGSFVANDSLHALLQRTTYSVRGADVQHGCRRLHTVRIRLTYVCRIITTCLSTRSTIDENGMGRADKQLKRETRNAGSAK